MTMNRYKNGKENVPDKHRNIAGKSKGKGKKRKGSKKKGY